MTELNFGGVSERVLTREEYTSEAALRALEGETVAVLGYGVQGPSQAKNLRDGGFRVIVGQRRGGASWDKALADGWVPGETLFGLQEAADRASVVLYLLSDAGQIEQWPAVRDALNTGDCLVFSHGFGITYREQTGIVAPEDVDVVLVAPKGSGTTLRRAYIDGTGVSASVAVHQDATGRAQDRVHALGMGVGAAYLFETDFKREVFSDLTGERGVLMGAIAGLIEAQYHVLRKNGHSPSEAFNETVEELTQSLLPLVGENGMDWMYANTSTTAQRGALDWRHRFRETTLPLFEELYAKVANGEEARTVIESCARPDYREKLDAELAEMRESELWQTGAALRALRPTTQA